MGGIKTCPRCGGGGMTFHLSPEVEWDVKRTWWDRAIWTRWQDLRERLALWIAPWLESPDFKEDV